jgi:hypothetical protein
LASFASSGPSTPLESNLRWLLCLGNNPAKVALISFMWFFFVSTKGSVFTLIKPSLMTTLWLANLVLSFRVTRGFSLQSVAMLQPL